MPKGGKRPGAGAPKGNLNALKHGRNSRQVRAFKLALKAIPATTDVLRRIDAVGEGQRALFAEALHHYADLIALGQERVQSVDQALFDQLQLPSPPKNSRTRVQSEDADPDPAIPPESQANPKVGLDLEGPFET